MEVKLYQIGERAMKGMSERMRKHAILIRDLAREYAPVKSGLLERSIDYAVIKENRRNTYIVFIDLDALRYNGKGQLGDYAWVMEQQLHPYGRQAGSKRYYLGPRSAAKAASGKKVGGRFLSRAIKDGNKTMLSGLIQEVRKVTGSSSVGVGAYNLSHQGDEQ